VPTEPSISRDRVFRFGPFELSERQAELCKSGVRIKLQEQPFRVLVELLANSGNLVSREDLHKKLWPADTFVDFDVGLNSAIRKLRQALGDDADNPRYIETLAKRGYRFVAPVSDNSSALPTVQDSAPEATDSPPVDNPPFLDSGNLSNRFAAPKAQRWYWVLAASCALALLIYGGVTAWRRTNTAPLATEQRITANPQEAPVTGAVVSRDGKYVAYSDTTGVYVRHIDTGETRPLQLPKGFDVVPTSWFPDGTNLLLSSGETLQGAGRINPEGVPTLWKVSLLGGDPRKLVEDANGGVVSPDGSNIAFLRTGARGWPEIWVMGTDQNNLRRVVEGANQDVWISGLAWSPAGTRIAYVRNYLVDPRVPPMGRHSVETVNVSGGATSVVYRSKRFLSAACWSADGRLLYGYSDDADSERGDLGVWSVRVSEKTGASIGEPLQVTKGAGRVGGLSITADGTRLLLWRDNLSPTVFLADIDSHGGEFKSLRRLTFDNNANVVTAWTPDSRAVVFSSNRHGTYKLFRQAIDQAIPEVLVEGRSILQARLSPDGKELFYLAGYFPDDSTQPTSLMAIPIGGGAPRVILQAPLIGDIQCARSPSKLCLLIRGDTPPAPPHVFSFDTTDGKLQPFVPLQGIEFGNWSLSPDGSQIAVASTGLEPKITFVGVAEANRREVTLDKPAIQGMDWSADSKSVLVGGWAANGASEVMSVEPGGDRRVLLKRYNGEWYLWVVPSPDGRHAAVTVLSGENNVWMIENF